MAIVITSNFGTTITNATGELETPFEITVKDGSKAKIGEEVEAFLDKTSLGKKTADANGKTSFTLTCSQGTTSLAGTIKATSVKKAVPWNHTIVTTKTSSTAATATPQPQIINKKTPDDTKDPVELQMMYYGRPTPGEFVVIIRILNIKGVGLNKKTVHVAFQGKREELTTKSGGVCEFTVNVKPGEEEVITAFTSGISQPATITIRCRREMTPSEKEAAQKNNQRARFFFAVELLASVLWLISSTLIISNWGLGGHLLSSSHELTAQEKFYNSNLGEELQAFAVKAPEAVESWQKEAIFLPLGFILIWMLFCCTYGILSQREEVAEIWSSGMETIVTRHFVRTQDPLLERMATWSGYLTRVRTQSTTAEPSAPATTTDNSKPNFWDYFRSDIMSDVIVEILPKIFKAIFGGK
jgi:hypothetical protein